MTSGDGGRHRCGACGSASPAASGSHPHDDALTRVVREEWGRLLALLIAHSRRLDLAEDALADAVEAAARTWPRDGVPANPAAWLHTSARRVLIDRLGTEPTMAARITRGKKKIVAAGIPFAIPALDDLPDRLDTVAHAFTAGYAAGSGPDLMHTELAGEAIHLVRVVRSLVPANSTLDGLLALMLLQHSRRDARLDADGEIVLLPDQDRNRWHHSEISEAIDLLDAIPAAPADAFRLQALIAAEHALAPTSVATRWDRIVAHYDALLIAFPSPAARLARAVALAETAGPEEGPRRDRRSRRRRPARPSPPRGPCGAAGPLWTALIRSGGFRCSDLAVPQRGGAPPPDAAPRADRWLFPRRVTIGYV